VKQVPWRVQSGPTGEFDEISVGQGKGQVLYAKRISGDQWVIEVDGQRTYVLVKKGVAKIIHQEKVGA